MNQYHHLGIHIVQCQLEQLCMENGVQYEAERDAVWQDAMYRMLRWLVAV